MKDLFFGEIVSSSLSQWVVQSWQWEKYPEFGSVVAIEEGDKVLLGVVSYIKTGSDDPTRQAFAYQKTENELRQEQPQIFEFLKTTFSIIPLGHSQQGQNLYALPSRPPKIHSFVRDATASEIKVFFCSGSALQALFSQYAQVECFDELLLATLRQLKSSFLLEKQFLLRVTDLLSLVTANDYRRQKLFMDRISSI